MIDCLGLTIPEIVSFNIAIYSILKQVHVSMSKSVQLRSCSHIIGIKVNFVAFESIDGGLEYLAITDHSFTSFGEWNDMIVFVA